jgi:hypothetical protein
LAFTRTISEAATSLLFAGGAIEPQIIDGVHAASVLADSALLDEIRLAAADMRSGSEDTDTGKQAVEGLSWAAELEVVTLQRLDLDSFADLARGSFLQFLSAQNKASGRIHLPCPHPCHDCPARRKARAVRRERRC